ncbi:hypothetical protein ACFY8B_27500 [Streptomyces sp. NPDC012751]|uniref:hypothetical protein n=1 Tax=Streptomyces sp. NPDC012751 TaxID=3364846 RepID=UPI0036AA0D3C
MPVPVRFDAGFRVPGGAPGVARAAVPLRRLTVNAPAAALVRGTWGPAYRRRAEVPGARVRGEDGPPRCRRRWRGWTAGRLGG